MASKFESYQKAKAELSAAKEWLEMIGKRQPRTTAEANGFLCALTVKAQVHYQHSDGAKNYHDAPETFGFLLGQAVKDSFDTLAAEALARLAARVDEMRKQAAEEYRQLLAEDAEPTT